MAEQRTALVDELFTEIPQTLADDRVLVTVSRTWTYLEAMRTGLTAHYRQGALLISGHCPDGDQQAEAIWRDLGGNVKPMPADWEKYGKQAGFIRNTQMVALGARICVAFMDRCRKPECREPGLHPSHGARHTARLAEEAGIPVDVYKTWGW